jgi:ParB family transcriptional regulator, chromosome partitioning protein
VALEERTGEQADAGADGGERMSKRDEIALRVLSKLQQREPPAPAEPSRARSMHTFIGQVGERMTQGFAARVEELERERRDGLVILALDPKHIRRAAQANRHALSLTEADEDFATLKQSLKRDGQIMPVSVRALEGDAEHVYELVSGHRRHEAALQLDRERPEGFKLRAVLDSAAQDPATLALHMYLENAARKDLSAYEVGAMFRTWLASGIFAEQQQIAEATGLGKPSISKYLQVAGLPAPVLNAFGDPRVIAVRWAEILIAALKANETAVLATARKLAARDERPAPELVLRQLAEAAESKQAKRSGTQTETVKIDGRTAFAYSLRNEKIAIRFGKHVEREVARELSEEIKELLTKRLKAKLGRGAGR